MIRNSLFRWMLIVLALHNESSALAGSFGQLISRRFPSSGEVPAEGKPPEKRFEFVQKGLLPTGSILISAAKNSDGSVWALTDKGPFRSQNGLASYVQLEMGPRTYEPGQPKVDPTTRINDLTSDALGQIWIATSNGVFITDGKQWWQPLLGRDGVPVESVNCIHLPSNGDVWAGSNRGAWLLRNGEFRYFWGKRWIPGNRVTRIWSTKSEKVWIETDDGLGCIEEVDMTLARKAEHYDEIAWERHNRRGIICQVDLKVPGDPSKGFFYEVSDNDGLWTSMYVGAMALRFASTKDPVAREHARISLSALLDLERNSGIPGFPARAMVTDEEVKGGIHGVDLNGKVHAPNVNAKVWYRSKLDPTLWCKGDTSSDELDGHYFAWYLYHDLVADEAEKKEIAAVIRRVTDYIIENKLTLVDHTGIKTRWGIWAPELINLDPFYHGLRPLNSIEILSFLKVAEHITGDTKYGKLADDLIVNHHYLLNTLMMRRGRDGRSPTINHSDDELLYLVYYPLLMLEKDPGRRRILTQSIARTWEYSTEEEQPLRPEHSPFYNFIYGATTRRRCDREEAVNTLRDWPWELVDWTTQNSQRQDVRLQTVAGRRRPRVQLDRVLPSSERSQGRWNSSPWTADEGSDGRVEHDGTAWALGYWLGVYHGYISPSE